LNTSDRLYFSKYALDSNVNALSNELDIFEFDDELSQDHFIRETDFDAFDDDLWED
jgi:hypothetical protein